MYSARLLDHFQNPRHPGELPDCHAQVRIENPVCGDILELSANLDGGIIREIRFRAKGCVPAMACGSAICKLATGLTVEDALRITPEKLLEEVGGVPQASLHAVQLAFEALKTLLRRCTPARDTEALEAGGR